MDKTIAINTSELISSFRSSFIDILLQIKEHDDELYAVLLEIFDIEVSEISICDNYCARLVDVAQIIDIKSFDSETNNLYVAMVDRFGKRKGILYSHFFDWCVSLSNLLAVLDNRREIAPIGKARKELFSSDKESQIFSVLAESKKTYCEFAIGVKEKDPIFYQTWKMLQDVTILDVKLQEDFFDRMELLFTTTNDQNLVSVSERLNISSNAYLENPTIKILIDSLYFIRGMAWIIEANN